MLGWHRNGPALGQLCVGAAHQHQTARPDGHRISGVSSAHPLVNLATVDADFTRIPAHCRFKFYDREGRTGCAACGFQSRFGRTKTESAQSDQSGTVGSHGHRIIACCFGEWFCRRQRDITVRSMRCIQGNDRTVSIQTTGKAIPTKIEWLEAGRFVQSAACIMAGFKVFPLAGSIQRTLWGGIRSQIVPPRSTRKSGCVEIFSTSPPI